MSLSLFLAMLVSQSAPINCDNPVTNSDLIGCAHIEFQQADAAMNAQWSLTSATLKRLDTDYPPSPALGESSRFEALLESQRAWLAYRDAHCDFYRSGGGRLAPLQVAVCLRDETAARTEALVQLALNPWTGQPYFKED